MWMRIGGCVAVWLCGCVEEVIEGKLENLCGSARESCYLI